MTDAPPNAPRHPLLLPLLVGIGALIVGAAITAWAGSDLHHIANATEAQIRTERLPIIGIITGSAIAVGGVIFALLWYTHRVLGRAHTPHRGLAIGVGIASGTVALLLAPVVEKAAAALPGFFGGAQGTGIISSFAEEALKLLVPVLLLLFVSVFRDPIVGFWTAVVSAAWFGVIEGVGYVATAAISTIKGTDGASTDAIVLGIDVVVRSWADTIHPLTTGGAAIVIWLASRTLPAARAWLVGIGAYLVASVLHALNDGVLGFYITNGLFSGLAILALGIVIFFVWYRPQVRRLRDAAE